MRYLATILLMLYSSSAVPEMGNMTSEWWQYWMFGRPCSTATDRLEGTCNLDVARKPVMTEKEAKRLYRQELMKGNNHAQSNPSHRP